MTKEEAIKRLETLLLHVDTDCVMGTKTTEAINMAIKALEQPEHRWIPCSEKLPEARGLYLTTTKDKVVYCDYWNEDNFNRTEMVIAWMPLPEPYKGEP